MKDGCWGDEVFLVLASYILQADLIVDPAFCESAVHHGLGFTLIKSFEKPKYQPLYLFAFSESDFNPVNYQSIRPNTDQNVVLTYWRENQDTIDESRTQYCRNHVSIADWS